jgi:hypothetical protein
MSRTRAIAMGIVLTVTAVLAFGLVLFLSRQAWPALPGTDHIEAGASARVVMWALWVGGVAIGVGIAIALWRPALAATRAAAMAVVAIGAVAWTALVAWALSIEFSIYPTDPEAAAAAAPYATASRALLVVAWVVGMLLAGGLLRPARSRR